MLCQARQGLDLPRDQLDERSIRLRVRKAVLTRDRGEVDGPGLGAREGTAEASYRDPHTLTLRYVAAQQRDHLPD